MIKGGHYFNKDLSGALFCAGCGVRVAGWGGFLPRCTYSPPSKSISA